MAVLEMHLEMLEEEVAAAGLVVSVIHPQLVGQRDLVEMVKVQ